MDLALIVVSLSQNWTTMTLRIKELCKEKHMTMKEIADKIGINHITLSQSLNGNPTMSRLQEVANALGVDISELFVRPKKDDVHGCVYVNGAPTIIKSKDDITSLCVKKETLNYLKRMKLAFEMTYNQPFSVDDFLMQMAAAVEDGDCAVWETFCQVEETIDKISKMPIE